MLQRANQDNPCPICDATNKKCASDLESNRYFCFYNSKTHRNFEYLRTSDVFHIYKEIGITSKTNFTKNTSKVKTARKSFAPKFVRTFTREERQLDINQVFNALNLLNEHRIDLQRRGLSKEQISASQFVSVSWDTLVPDVIGAAPGFSQKGKWSMGEAMLVPCFNLDGDIISYQVKNNNTDYGKYIWAKAFEDKTQNLLLNDSKIVTNYKSELPLQTVKASSPQTTVYLCEGILKPIVASFKHDITVIGASGGSFKSSEQYFKNLLRELKPQQVVWLADANSAANTGVSSRIIDTAKWLKSNFDLAMQVADWGQIDNKKGDDCDEIETSTLNTANFVSWRKTFVALDESTVETEVAKLIAEELSRPDVFGSGQNHLTNNVTFKYKAGNLPVNTSQGLPSYFFKPVERQTLLSEAYAKGYKFVLDVSQTGASKSHYSGELKTELFTHSEGGANKIWYFHARHREPSTTTLDLNFTEHPTKNTVLYESNKRTPATNKPVLVRERPFANARAVAGNCDKAERQTELYQAGAKFSMCEICNHASKCAEGVEKGVYGYRFEVKEALKHDRIRANYYGVNPKSIDEDDVAVIDEYSQTLEFVDTITVSQAEWFGSKKLINRVLKENQDLLSELEDIITGQRIIDKFGVNYADLETLIPKNQWSSLFAYINEANQIEVENNTQRAMDGLSPKLIWVAELFKALCGQFDNYSVTVRNGSLTIFRRNLDTLEKLHKFRTVVFMDATSTRESLAAELGCTESDILLISCQPQPINNVTIKQIVSVGTPNKSRTAKQRKKIEILREWAVNKYKEQVGFIDWKIYCKKGDLAHFVDGRGSNAFQHKKAIMAFGSANTNVCAAKATFECIYEGKIGKGLTQSAFSNYYEKLNQAETEQEIGRLRGSRRDETLEYFVVCTNNLQYLKERGYSYEVVRGFEIDDRICNNRELIIAAAVRLRDRGVLHKMSVKKLAKEANVSERNLYYFAKSFKGGISYFKELIFKQVYDNPNYLIHTLAQSHKNEQVTLDTLIDLNNLKTEVRGYHIIETDNDLNYIQTVVSNLKQ